MKKHFLMVAMACASVLIIGVERVPAQQGGVSQIEQSRQEQAKQKLKGGVASQPIDTWGESAPATTGDADLGVQQILKEKKKERPLTFFSDYSCFYTDNAAMTAANPFFDFMQVGTVGASYQHTFTPLFFGDVTYRHQFFRYSNHTDLAFDVTNPSCGLTYVAKDWWELAFYTRYDYTRLTYGNSDNEPLGGAEGTEFYKNHDVTIGLQKMFELSKAQHIYAGTAAKFGMTDYREPDQVDPQRYEYSATAGYTLDVSRWFQTGVNYRYAYNDYIMQSGRADGNQVVSNNYAFKLTEWATINLSWSFTQNISNRSERNYRNLSAGGGLAMNVRF